MQKEESRKNKNKISRDGDMCVAEIKQEEKKKKEKKQKRMDARKEGNNNKKNKNYN